MEIERNSEDELTWVDEMSEKGQQVTCFGVMLWFRLYLYFSVQFMSHIVAECYWYRSITWFCRCPSFSAQKKEICFI